MAPKRGYDACIAWQWDKDAWRCLFWVPETSIRFAGSVPEVVPRAVLGGAAGGLPGVSQALAAVHRTKEYRNFKGKLSRSCLGTLFWYIRQNIPPLSSVLSQPPPEVNNFPRVKGTVKEFSSPILAAFRLNHICDARNQPFQTKTWLHVGLQSVDVYLHRKHDVGLSA